jgi:hypothetical protein
MPYYSMSYIRAGHKFLEDWLPYTTSRPITRHGDWIGTDGVLYLFARYVGEEVKKDHRRRKSRLEELLGNKKEELDCDEGSEVGEIIERGPDDDEIFDFDKEGERKTSFIHARFGSGASDSTYRTESEGSIEEYEFNDADSDETSDSDSSTEDAGSPTSGLPTPSLTIQIKKDGMTQKEGMTEKEGKKEKEDKTEKEGKKEEESKIVDFENPFLIEELKWLIEGGLGATRVFEGVEWWFEGFRGMEYLYL